MPQFCPAREVFYFFDPNSKFEWRGPAHRGQTWTMAREAPARVVYRDLCVLLLSRLKVAQKSQCVFDQGVIHAHFGRSGFEVSLRVCCSATVRCAAAKLIMSLRRSDASLVGSICARSSLTIILNGGGAGRGVGCGCDPARRRKEPAQTPRAAHVLTVRSCAALYESSRRSGLSLCTLS